MPSKITSSEHKVAEARDQMERMLKSKAFQISSRNQAFFRYIVEQTLAGNEDRIKAYSIAIEVFGRGDTFDPQVDPVVRIEAKRIRRAIELYFLTDGKNDPIRIYIPKGGYVPVFEASETSDLPIAEEIQTPVHPPSVFVVPFEVDGDHENHANFARGFTRQVVISLTRFSDLFVYGPETTAAMEAPSARQEFLASAEIDFVVKGGLTIESNRLLVEALMIDAKTKRVVWGHTFERDLQPDQVMEVRNEVADSITRTLGQPYGVIFSKKALEIEGRPPKALTSYQCVIRFYQYWRHFDPELFAQVAHCLTNTIAKEPDYAEAHACLSQLLTDSVRFGFPLPNHVEDPISAAIKHANTAIELAPQSNRGLHALATAYWFSGDLEASLDAYEAALALNPNATEVMGDLGLRLAMNAEWDRAVPLLREAYKRNPTQSVSLYVGFHLFHFMHDQFEEALVAAKKAAAPGVVYGQLCMAAALAELGRIDEARSAVGHVLDVAPNYGSRIVEDLRTRQLHPKIIDKLIQSLHRAGLPMHENVTIRPNKEAS
ncbi:MAG: hypothetical protein WBV78_12035 [Roseobacter sp.]